MGQADRKRLFQNIIRLRRAEREAPGNRDLGAVRTDLERQLGETVSRAFAAQLLEVSPAALSRWIQRGEFPVVVTPSGRVAVPVGALADLYEAVERERAAGRKHALEAVVRKSHDRAAKLQPGALLEGEVEGGDPRRGGELRSLVYHRAVARRLTRSEADDALTLVRRWRSTGRIDHRYADAWEAVLTKPLPDIRRVLREDTDLARDLRQNSPFAGSLSEPERRKIVSEIR
jgi:hypothetical protein